MSAITRLDYWLQLITFLRNNIFPIYLFLLSQNNVGVLLSPLYIVIFCHLYFFPLYRWVLPFLVFLITLEALCWAIILFLYCYISLLPLSVGLCGITILVVFILAKWRCITVASVIDVLYFSLFSPRGWVWQLVVVADF